MGKIIAGFAGLIALVIIFTALGAYYTVDQGSRGVITRWGKVVGVADPGLSFKTPWIDGVTDISIQQQARLYEKLQAYSNDQQPADMKVSVNFHITDPAKVYANYGAVENLQTRVLDRKVPQDLKTVFGQFTASSVIQDRAKFNAQVTDLITKDLAGEGVLMIDSVQVENVDFSDAYEQAVEQRMLAQVAVQKINQQVDQQQAQAKITVINAQAQADAQLATATANAKATRLAGDAEAAAIKARGDALAANPSLVALTAAERWDGKLPATMVPGGSVPFIGVK